MTILFTTAAYRSVHGLCMKVKNKMVFAVRGYSKEMGTFTFFILNISFNNLDPAFQSPPETRLYATEEL